MAAQKFDFTKAGCDSSCGGMPCEQGATFFYQLVWEKETTPGSQIYVPIDLTGYAAKMQVRQKIGASLLIELSTVNSRIVLTPSIGQITLNISATDTNILVPGIYKYDLELTDGSGFVTRFIEGLFEVVGQITV